MGMVKGEGGRVILLIIQLEKRGKKKGNLDACGGGGGRGPLGESS